MRPVRLRKSFPRELVSTSLKIPRTTCIRRDCGEQSFTQKVKDVELQRSHSALVSGLLSVGCDVKGFPNNVFMSWDFYLHSDKQELEGSSFWAKWLSWWEIWTIKRMSPYLDLGLQPTPMVSCLFVSLPLESDSVSSVTGCSGRSARAMGTVWVLNHILSSNSTWWTRGWAAILCLKPSS